MVTSAGAPHPGASKLKLFEGVGLEIEYMIVDPITLKIKPIADQLFSSVTGEICSDVSDGEMEWSNELVAHVVEVKNPVPTQRLELLAENFARSASKINSYLKPMRAKILPTAMHPFMDPESESRLWPHDNQDIYFLYDRIFNCKGHGWTNLQSMHLNLPFATDKEFERLHTAVRLILPLLPALSASSPITGAQKSNYLDARLHFYSTNQSSIPEISGQIVPEFSGSESDYRRNILEPMFKAIAPHDPQSLLQDEWLNSRGAIPKFSRNSIEIRILDSQESPIADCAIAALIIQVLKGLVDESILPFEKQKRFATGELKKILDATTREGDLAKIDNSDFLSNFGLPVDTTAQDFWISIYERSHFRSNHSSDFQKALENIFANGCLSRRILKEISDGSSILNTYQRLAGCLEANDLFQPASSGAVDTHERPNENISSHYM